MSKVLIGVFRCILDYCEPAMKKRIKHYKNDARYPINYIWPEEVCYQNPIRAFKSYGYCLWFKLKSGEKTDNTA